MNKSNGDDLLSSVKIIQKQFDSSDQCSVNAHYSLKYNKSRKMDGQANLLKDFIAEMNHYGKQNEVLVVSGSGAKAKFNSVSALQRLRDDSVEFEPKLSVAHNPFFPEEQDLVDERRRLEQKLETGLVSKIYLQFGTDLDRLRSSLEELKALQAKTGHNFDICGSIFLPTEKLIAQQKFRPWNGVFLSDEFLSGENTARGIVLQMMKLYEEHSCQILIEAPGVRTEKDWSVIESLLNERDEKVSASGTNSKSKKQVPNASKKDGSPAKKRKANEGATDTSSEPDSSSGIPKSTLTPQQLSKPAIVLFHSHDCRLHDNVAVQLASHHACVIPLFIWSRKEQGQWGVRGCMEVILKDALRNLDEKLRSHGLKLIYRQSDDSSEVLRQLCEECESSAVYYNIEHTPESRVREAKYRRVLGEIDVESVECQSSLLYDPTSPQLATGFHGGHWGTLMPFLKGCQKQLGEPRKPVQRFETFAMLETTAGPVTWPSSSSIDGLDLAVIKGEKRWDKAIIDRFPMSEDAAHSNLEQFFKAGFGRYESDRSRADLELSTSKLSAHLRIGTLSPNVLYYKTEASELDYPQRKTFSRRLFWRDLAYFHLQSFPDMRGESIRLHCKSPRFLVSLDTALTPGDTHNRNRNHADEETKWCDGEEGDRRYNAWKSGRTGFPLVDAGMYDGDTAPRHSLI